MFGIFPSQKTITNLRLKLSEAKTQVSDLQIKYMVTNQQLVVERATSRRLREKLAETVKELENLKDGTLQSKATETVSSRDHLVTHRGSSGFVHPSRVRREDRKRQSDDFALGTTNDSSGGLGVGSATTSHDSRSDGGESHSYGSCNSGADHSGSYDSGSAGSCDGF